MKPFHLLILAFVAGILPAHAQKNFFGQAEQVHSNAPIIRNMLSRQFTNEVASKPTDMQQRIKAQAFTELSGSTTTVDSFRYTYSDRNSSSYNYNDIGYNQDFEPAYAPMFIDHRYEYNPEDLLADSIVSYNNGVVKDLQRAYYRSDKKIDSISGFSDNNSGGLYRNSSAVFYTPEGHVSSIYALKDNGVNPLDTYSVRNFYYNTDQSKVLADTEFINPPVVSAFSVNNYAYNAVNGRLDTMYTSFIYTGGALLSRTLFSYYADGKLAKVVRQAQEGTDWITQNYDSLGYDGASGYYTYWKQTSLYVSGSQVFEVSHLTRQFPGASGHPDSTWQYAWNIETGSWIPAIRWTFEYNEAGNPSKIVSTSYESGSPQPMGHAVFYYETYSDGLSIQDAAASKVLPVFPNPFTDHIAINWEQSQGTVYLHMVNISGQTIFKKEMIFQVGINMLSLPELSAGTYMLQVRDNRGNVYNQRLIKK